MELFFELIQVALGTRDELSRVPSVDEWGKIYAEAQRQAVIGIAVDGIDGLPQEQRPEQMMILEWIGAAEMVRQRNSVLNKRSVEIQEVFAKAGYRSCILKGQGNALMYPNPYSRMPGDIDIWVEGDRHTINKFVDSLVTEAHKGYKDVAFHYNDVEVEAHIFPTYLNSYSKNKHLQQYIEEHKGEQFANFVELYGGSKICVPMVDFNVIYQMCHLYHHFFCEGIGLRHFIDYYYLLKRLQPTDEGKWANDLFRQLRMTRFVAGVMWVEKEVLGITEDCLIGEVDEKTGRLILKEILEYGNFNKAGKDGQSVMSSKISNTFRPVKYILQFPKESIDRILFLARLQWWKLFERKKING